MKKFISLVALFAATFICVESVSAQVTEVVGTEVDSTASSTDVTQTVENRSSSYTYYSSTTAPQESPAAVDYGPKVCSFELDYIDVKDSSRLGASLCLGGLAFHGEYATLTDVSDAYEWSAGVGINKRVYIFNLIYLEGRLGASYEESCETIDGELYKDGNWGYFAYPRAAIRLFENTCITAGYKWKFANFSFAEDNTSEFMTFGIAFTF